MNTIFYCEKFGIKKSVFNENEYILTLFVNDETHISTKLTIDELKTLTIALNSLGLIEKANKNRFLLLDGGFNE